MPKTKEELEQLKRDYKAVTNKIKELTEDELKQFAGGFIGNISSFVYPSVLLFSSNGYPLFLDCIVKRVSDDKYFRCKGYENNNTGTAWEFVNESGTYEQFSFNATPSEDVLLGYVH